jgi:hypothetical protein
MTKTAGALTLIAAVFASSTASAFSAMYVGKGEARLVNKVAHVVVMRDGARTIVSMQNEYVGPPEPFAMIVPLPSAIAKGNVKTLARDTFEGIDKIAGPRLVEYWEQDPCGPSSLQRIAPPAKSALAGAAKPDIAVLADAAYAVGEYDVVVLSAKELAAWLTKEGYVLPPDAEPYLRPYVDAGNTFIVARVDGAKLKMEYGKAQLSPLRFHYDAPELTVPVRIGLANSPGVQELVLDILANEKRYDAASAPIPTNLDVAETTRDKFTAFYTSLYDKTLEKSSKTIVTEYAWSTPDLSGRDLASFGGDMLPAEANPDHNAVVLPRGIPADPMARGASTQLATTLRACFQPMAKATPDLRGAVELTLSFDEGGAVKALSFTKDEIRKPELVACVKSATSAMRIQGVSSAGNLILSFTVTSMPEHKWRSWTLSRLHTRYGKDAEDLVLKEAPAIEGGREKWDDHGQLEHGSRAGAVNGFQARYAIRHPWSAEIGCPSPRRGVWRGATNDALKSEGATAVVASRFSSPETAPIDLKPLVKSDAPEIDLQGRPAAAPPEDAPVVSKGESSSRGCSGCSVAGLALFVVRRKRSERRHA